ncbi:MAG: hypothetical protein PHU42_04305 [Patescibacteria group bacterium]|nr:hypothetical protein [Patescibacteria group bacterium]
MAEEKKVKAKNGKLKKFLIYAGVVALILAAVIISLLFYRQKIETTNTVFKNLTQDWQTYKNDKYHLSFKYPKDWVVTDLIDPYKALEHFLVINPDQNHSLNEIINVSVSESRNIAIQDPDYAIQISIPFDKKNYLIFSTSTDNPNKEAFYNIPVTLEIGK